MNDKLIHQVAKLQTHDFSDPAQAQLAREQCARYKRLMEQFEQMQLPEEHLIPVQREKKAKEAESPAAAADESPDTSVAQQPVIRPSKALTEYLNIIFPCSEHI